MDLEERRQILIQELGFQPGRLFMYDGRAWYVERPPAIMDGEIKVRLNGEWIPVTECHTFETIENTFAGGRRDWVRSLIYLLERGKT
jgi:hypothetical protein